MNESFGKFYLHEDLVVNKSFFQPLARDLSCVICEGLLSSPALCTECETPYCGLCIERWIIKKNNCAMGCKGKFKSKKPSKALKAIMDLIILKCKTCGKESTLLDYPNHNCEPRYEKIRCPFCPCCEIDKADALRKDVDINLIPNHKMKIDDLDNELSAAYNLIRDQNKTISELKDLIEKKTEIIEKLQKDTNEYYKRPNMYKLEKNESKKKTENYINSNSPKNRKVDYSERSERLNTYENNIYYEPPYKILEIIDGQCNGNLERNKKSCQHYPESKSIPFFDCCKRSFYCYKCHDYNSDHKCPPAESGNCKSCGEYYKTKGKSCESCHSMF